MKRFLPLTALLLTACAATPVPVEDSRGAADRTAMYDPARIRADLVASASERYGTAAFDYAMRQPSHLVTKVYMGMMPPPPPGAAPDWRPTFPVALLYRSASGWQVATAAGFRPANAFRSARIDQILASSAFWAERSATSAGCTDAGAALSLVKVPGHSEMIRQSLCGPALSDELARIAIEG